MGASSTTVLPSLRRDRSSNGVYNPPHLSRLSTSPCTPHSLVGAQFDGRTNGGPRERGFRGSPSNVPAKLSSCTCVRRRDEIKIVKFIHVCPFNRPFHCSRNFELDLNFFSVNVDIKIFSLCIFFEKIHIIFFVHSSIVICRYLIVLDTDSAFFWFKFLLNIDIEIFNSRFFEEIHIVISSVRAS